MSNQKNKSFCFKHFSARKLYKHTKWSVPSTDNAITRKMLTKPNRQRTKKLYLEKTDRNGYLVKIYIYKYIYLAVAALFFPTFILFLGCFFLYLCDFIFDYFSVFVLIFFLLSIFVFYPAVWIFVKFLLNNSLKNVYQLTVHIVCLYECE